VNLGETFRVRAEHLQYLGRLKNFAMPLDLQFDHFDFASYDTYKQIGFFKLHYLRLRSRLQYSASRNFSLGAGFRFEWQRYTPTITNGLEYKGSNNFTTAFGYIAHNSLDRAIYPRKGVKVYAEAGRVSKQHPNLTFLMNGETIPYPDPVGISTEPYLRTILNVESYVPLGRKATFLMEAQGGINFDYSSQVMNEFVVGGMTPTFRNQVTFAGFAGRGNLYACYGKTIGWIACADIQQYLSHRTRQCTVQQFHKPKYILQQS
jgi:hypothetical protein